MVMKLLNARARDRGQMRDLSQRCPSQCCDFSISWYIQSPSDAITEHKKLQAQMTPNKTICITIFSSYINISQKHTTKSQCAHKISMYIYQKHQSTGEWQLLGKILRGLLGVRSVDDFYFLTLLTKLRMMKLLWPQIRNQKPSEERVGVRNISELIESLHLPAISSYFKLQTWE